jgi:hypothetical protein
MSLKQGFFLFFLFTNRRALRWFHQLDAARVGNWTNLQQAFLNEFFPHERTVALN